MAHLKVGNRVHVLRKREGATVREEAVIRWKGKPHFATTQDTWVGVELDTETGKNDGEVNGTRYFQCLPNHGLMVKSANVKPIKTGAIFDRLTDPSKYTGSHKLRFDESGQGRGREGRVDEDEAARGKPTAHPMTRSSPHSGYVSGFKPKVKAKSTGKKASGKPSIFDKLTDPSLYTGAHKARFDTSGKGRGKEGREDVTETLRRDAHLVNTRETPHSGYVSGFKKGRSSKSPNPKKAGPSIFDKLTDPSLYTGSHKERFDAKGKGKGKAGRVDEREAFRRESHLAGTRSSKNTGYVAGFKPSPKKPTSANSGKPSIFDKLTDATLYTGAHKHRFDGAGKGKGKEGREDEREVRRRQVKEGWHVTRDEDVTAPEELEGMENVRDEISGQEVHDGSNGVSTASDNAEDSITQGEEQGSFSKSAMQPSSEMDESADSSEVFDHKIEQRDDPAKNQNVLADVQQENSPTESSSPVSAEAAQDVIPENEQLCEVAAVSNSEALEEGGDETF